MEADGLESRVARLEERMVAVHALVAEIREQQRDVADTISRASGGMKVLLLLGGIAGAFGALRAAQGWVTSTLHGS